MKRPSQKVFVLLAGVLIVLSAGCNEQGLSDTRRSRIVADENRQLRKELESQKKLLTKCLEEREVAKTKLETDMWSIAAPFIDENAILRQENKKLKAEIEQLKAGSAASE